MEDRSDRLLIIGAGPTGLVVARSGGRGCAKGAAGLHMAVIIQHHAEMQGAAGICPRPVVVVIAVVSGDDGALGTNQNS